MAIRISLAAAFVALFALPAVAQSDQDALKKKLADKLGETWLTKGEWITNYDRAREEAKSAGKIILAYFTRSYSY